MTWGLPSGAHAVYQGRMRLSLAPLLILLTAACTPRPEIAWPAESLPPPPALLPLDALHPPATGPDPGPAIQARADALRSDLGISP